MENVSTIGLDVAKHVFQGKLPPRAALFRSG
jgi:hypothetical protein